MIFCVKTKKVDTFVLIKILIRIILNKCSNAHETSEMNEIYNYLFAWPNEDHFEGLQNISLAVTKKRFKEGSWWNHLIAGGVAGGVSRTCTAPLDRMKLFLQVQTHKTGILEGLRIMIKEGGALGMWRGNGINVIKMTPESAIKFSSYEKSKQYLRGEELRNLTMSERFFAGAFAGNLSQSVIYPMDVLKTRLALAKTGQYKGIISAANEIFAKEGLKSFYRGYSAFVLGIMLYCGIDLAVYETTKNHFIEYTGGHEKTMYPLLVLSCGAISTTVGQLATYPLALLGTRLQAKVVSKKCKRIKRYPLENNLVRLIWIIFQREGVSGLYRGLVPNFMKSVPSVCITYIVYEYMITLLGESMT